LSHPFHTIVLALPIASTKVVIEDDPMSRPCLIDQYETEGLIGAMTTTDHPSIRNARLNSGFSHFSILSEFAASNKVLREMDLDVLLFRLGEEILNNFGSFFIIKRVSNL
jgi:hypothetical protein